MDLLELYNTNEEFKEYVDKSCKTYNRTLEESLQNKMSLQYALYLEKEGRINVRSGEEETGNNDSLSRSEMAP